MRLPALFIALATALHAAVPLKDPRITGTDAKVSSGTFTIKSGATLAAEAGAIFAFAEKVPLSAGGTGVSLSDPGADRILFWDDSAGALTWLTIGSGLSLTGTTLTTDATAAAPPDATYLTQTANGTLTNEFAMGTLATGIVKNTTTTGVPSIAVAGTDYVAPGAATASGLTMSTARVLGRTTAGTGAIEEISIGSNLSLASTTLDLATSPTITTPTISGAITFPAGVKQTFAPNGTTAGINVGSVAGDPSTPANGDLWYDSTANELTARINGANVALGAGGGGGGSGDVVGPASSTDARLALFDSTTGKLLKQSSALTESGGTITSNTAIGLTAGGTNQNITFTPSGTGVARTNFSSGVGGILQASSSTGYSVLSLRNNLDSGSRAFNFGYAGSSYAGSLVSNGFSGESGYVATSGSYPMAFGIGNFFAFGVNTEREVLVGDSSDAGDYKLQATSAYIGTGGLTFGQATSSGATGMIRIYGPDASRSAITLRNAESDGSTAGVLYFSKGYGSLGSPSAVQSGSRLGVIAAGGYAGSGTWADAQAAIRFYAAETWSGSARGAGMVLESTPTGSSTRTGRMIIGPDGKIHIGDSTSDGYLSGSSGALTLTAQGTNQNITLTPSGTGQVRATNRLYVGEGSVAFGGYQSLILAREGNSYGGALGIHHGNNPTDNFAWSFQRARGTLASPSAVQSGDRLGQFTFAGYNGSAYGNTSSIYADATENWGGSAQGAQLTFAVTANGTTTRTDRVFVRNSGLLEATAGINLSGGDIQADKTITAGGTTGAQTINKNAGSVNFAASAGSLVVTDSRVSTSSVIIATVATNDTTMKSVAVVAAAGSFTIYPNAAPTAETRVNFFIVN